MCPVKTRVLLRTNGFALGGVLRGHFRLERLGVGQRFMRRGSSPYLRVRTETDYIIINVADPRYTRDFLRP